MPRKPQFTIKDVIEAAFKLVRQNGWSGLSASAVAGQLGCSTMPIYSHFKNMEKLQDEVVKKGWKLLYEYESKSHTGDVWVDHAIAYVEFAKKETNLFLCMFDGRNLDLQRKMLREHWIHLSHLLEGYAPFTGLSEVQSLRIRYSRAMLSHGVATSVSVGWSRLLQSDDLLKKYLTMASKALLKGYKDIDVENGGDNLSLDERFSEIIKDLS